MRKKICACLLSASLLLSSSFAFSDLTREHWAYDVVNKMQGKGIISGFLDNTFQPESSVTRAQFATMLVKTIGLPLKSGTSAFADVEGHWAKDYVSSVAEFISGEMINNRYCFRPEDASIREEVAMAVVKAKGLENKAYNPSTLDGFRDKYLISQEAQKYVAIAVENGIMKGNIDKTFNPKGKITRAEITALMYNLSKMPVVEVPKTDNVTEKTENPYVTFREKYVNNNGKYAEVKFTEINGNSFEMYLVGYNEVNGAFGIYQPITVNGKVGTFSVEGNEKLKILFNKNVVNISSSDKNYDIFAGDYQIGVSVNSIEGLVEDKWNATYSIGQQPEISAGDSSFSNVIYKIVGFSPVGESEVRFTASAIVNGAVTALSETAVLAGNTAIYDNGSIQFSITEEGTLEIEVSDSAYKDLAGIYLKQTGEDKFTRYKGMAEATVLHYGTIVMKN
ncbi:MAG: S-layer homology domain-containing protein [Clostridia bacterium]|nr:S-layer homology domain-containing protein [Clostridia bacterium]